MKSTMLMRLLISAATPADVVIDLLWVAPFSAGSAGHGYRRVKT
jgi:hypothetical protein